MCNKQPWITILGGLLVYITAQKCKGKIFFFSKEINKDALKLI